MNKEKRCSKCKEVKPIEAFHFKDKTHTTRKTTCIACRAEYHRQYSRRYFADPKNFQKANARFAVNNAIRAGKLLKPSFCEGCGSDKRLQAHHEDYGKPLDVIWLCKPCHYVADMTLVTN